MPYTPYASADAFLDDEEERDFAAIAEGLRALLPATLVVKGTVSEAQRLTLSPLNIAIANALQACDIGQRLQQNSDYAQFEDLILGIYDEVEQVGTLVAAVDIAAVRADSDTALVKKQLADLAYRSGEATLAMAKALAALFEASLSCQKCTRDREQLIPHLSL